MTVCDTAGASTTYFPLLCLFRFSWAQFLNSSTSARVNRIIKLFPASGSFHPGESSCSGIGGDRTGEGDSGGGGGDSGDSLIFTFRFKCRGPATSSASELSSYNESLSLSILQNSTLIFGNYEPPAPNMTPLSYPKQ